MTKYVKCGVEQCNSNIHKTTLGINMYSTLHMQISNWLPTVANICFERANKSFNTNRIQDFNAHRFFHSCKPSAPQNPFCESQSRAGWPTQKHDRFATSCRTKFFRQTANKSTIKRLHLQATHLKTVRRRMIDTKFSVRSPSHLT